MQKEILIDESTALLQSLIAIESFSKQEDKTADAIQAYFESKGIRANRKLNNVWAYNKYFNPELPSILLNSHHDTVKPVQGWTLDPFEPLIQDGKLFGLGSNDAGASLVSLITTFLHFYEKRDLKYNLCIAATAEEENSGLNGLELVLPDLGKMEFAIIGEPTQMHLAIAEKGLMVLDCVVTGKSGHAAREEGDNAIYKALRDIQWFNTFQFPKVSEFLGPVKMSVTMIQAGIQHNVVPDRCTFTVDVRVTDVYKNEEVLELIKQYVQSEVHPRSVRLKSSSISKEHPIVQAGSRLGRQLYGSPTSSDQALINFPSLKMGPGDSSRSHTANEFIYLDEIKEGINLYIQLLNQVLY